MEIMTVVSAAIAALGARLADPGPGLPERADAGAIDRICTLVSGRLRLSSAGSDALDQLQRQPSDPAARESATLFLLGEAGRDPEFATALAELVSALPARMVVGDGTSVGRSRRARISVSGWVAIAAVLAIVLAAGGIAVAQVLSGHDGVPVAKASATAGGDVGGASSSIGPLVDDWAADRVPASLTLTMRISESGHFDIVGAGVDCAGSVEPLSTEGEYRFAAEQGWCDSTTGQLSADGKTLTLGPPGHTYVFVRK